MAEKLTPLLRQYHRIKQKYPNTLLLFRVGDFYEMFYEDAEIGAKALNLTLTSRPHGPDIRVPLAGIPVKALDTYVARLVAQGLKVAICDQLEEPDPRKPVVARDVVEIITPGTITRTSLLDANRNNYIMALSPHGNKWGISFADLTTGEFSVGEVTSETVADEIERISPAEIVIPQSWTSTLNITPEPRFTRIDDYYFTEEFAFEKLTHHLGVLNLAGYGIDDLNEGICAAGALLEYLEQTQRGTLPHLRRIQRYITHNFLLLDRITRRNLELIEPLHLTESKSDIKGTLFWVLNQTKTPGGARLLRRWILSPLLSVKDINYRLDAINELKKSQFQLNELQALLRQIGDIERISSRIALGRAGPRELAIMKKWLSIVPNIKDLLQQFNTSRLRTLKEKIPDLSPVVDEINNVLVEDPPVTHTEGGIVRSGVNSELDELRSLASHAKEYIARIQERERQRTGIPNLRVGFNSVFGYYIEVTKSYLANVPRDYIRKQTVVNGERFITHELKELEDKLLHAEERIKTIESELFINLRNKVARYTEQLFELAGTIAELDVLASLTQVAINENYVRPEINESGIIDIKAGRHPVVEKMLKDPFIPNDIYLNSADEQILIITGPNMAGKSTYLRQVALIVIMAQMGSFVPADSARIGIVDKIFTRIGASDDVARGVSTFLAEMLETANILNNATTRSLIILDEVGRGTATKDGLAIAWATVEYLHGSNDFCPRTLFATHYHELTQITRQLPRVKNYSFLVRERGDQVIFLRKIHPGPADKSYGIAVAKLAGLPSRLLERAKELLIDFNCNNQTNFPRDDSELTTPLADQNHIRTVIERLQQLEIESLTPLQALNLLAELKKLVQEFHL
ncbi:MAG: DNA mismatch repair protein MutS [candidate division WOR-3 bacterium]